MANKFKSGDTVRVKAAMFIRGDRKGNYRRIMRGQVFTLDENDNVDRSDIDLILEPVEGSAEASEETTYEPSTNEVWDENIETDELSRQLADMNLNTAKKYLSREEWTLGGMQVARQAEENGADRSGLLEFIDGRILDLQEESSEGESSEG